MKPRLLAVALAAGVITPSLYAQDPAAEISPPVRHSAALGFFYSKGDYGQDLPTRVRYLPYTHEISVSGWRFKASVPLLEISGPGNILVDGGNIGGDPSVTVAEKGIGDINLSATWEMPLWSDTAPFVDLTVMLKLPTADEKRGLGTGRPDLGVQMDAYQNLGDFTLFATLGYRHRHRSPVFEGLNDSVNISLGFSRGIGESLQTGLIYDYQQAASEFSGDAHELLPYLSWAVSSQLTAMVYLIEGFTVDSADTALGLQITRRW